MNQGLPGCPLSGELLINYGTLGHNEPDQSVPNLGPSRPPSNFELLNSLGATALPQPRERSQQMLSSTPVVRMPVQQSPSVLGSSRTAIRPQGTLLSTAQNSTAVRRNESLVRAKMTNKQNNMGLMIDDKYRMMSQILKRIPEAQQQEGNDSTPTLPPVQDLNLSGVPFRKSTPSISPSDIAALHWTAGFQGMNMSLLDNDIPRKDEVLISRDEILMPRDPLLALQYVNEQQPVSPTKAVELLVREIEELKRYKEEIEANIC